ncbi:hypothetical protein FACS1894172_15190 [Spirochaetia bacterium]|nr:hypothetical protein FACS1894164_04120 [Spirochaetia bacterium]GHU34639.1 hypothetical protein FACS1894172_15190 [Spirochaetia bacterium]
MSDDLKSVFYNPLNLERNYYRGVKTISPYYGRSVSYKTLRRVSEKAWILNLCIQNIIKKIRPFLKESTSENQRGFRVTKKGMDKTKQLSPEEQKEIQRLTNFFINTGDITDDNRVDDLDKYVSKIVRDISQLDQLATELQRTLDGEVVAFWAVDPATIEVAMPESEKESGIKYVQVIDSVPYAFYPKTNLLFDCMNPRSDIDHAGYGYSLVEQAIDLVTSSINTFMYNAGFFTENKLPRGFLLLNGDPDREEVEEIEDYISNLMSGPPTSQWHVPIIPTGSQKSGEGARKFEWVNLQGTNREMEFQTWYDLQLSALVAMFGASLEDLGLHSQKSQPLIGADNTPKIESSKSMVLGDMLGFLQKHFNTILKQKAPEYIFEFIGYERDDPRLTMEIDKSEVDTYKSIDEKRIEKGIKPFNTKWSQVPLSLLSPAAVPLFMAEEGAGDSINQGEDSGWEHFGTDAETAVEKALQEPIRIVI